MNRLRDSFSPYWQSIQKALFPHLEQELGPLTAKQQQLAQTLEVIRIEQWLPPQFRAPGRPPSDRAALGRAFVAKAVYDMPTTRVLLDRLDTDVALLGISANVNTDFGERERSSERSDDALSVPSLRRRNVTGLRDPILTS